ncbi:MAG: tRNA uridine-5-carboxymethylaminomethyl(34) synthesis GTPase MnmE [Rhabdochlamydiaceae bacterium]|nr:tRNA uridine-5-carboxymethylaminomethyl(34) synthesis GTPase MnmE [Rhabdochlamydiaceae bacterium]
MHFVHRPYIPEETIAAIATPPGEGGISIIRISGKHALPVAAKIFTGPVFSYPSHTAHLGKIQDRTGHILDEVLLLVMKNPKSFTGEDTVEIHCHGGTIVTKKILEEVLWAGARAALPGEFSLKAFMNGKLDLTQAEAIQQVISAKNEMAYAAAEQHLQGALSKYIKRFQAKLLDVAAILEAWVDFPEEGLEFASQEEILASLSEILEGMSTLSRSFYEGKILHEGLSLCLIGPPNAGKSSLMNAMLGKERAIVTEIAGTTRDLLEDHLWLGGLHFKLVDTAGIRETQERIEKEGIRRSFQAMESCDLILLVLDASVPLSAEALSLLQSTPKEKTLLIWNKADLPHTIPPDLFPFSLSLSALTGTGIDALKAIIHKMIWKSGPPSKEEVLLTNIRHKEALDRAIAALQSIIQGLQENLSPEFLSFDMRKALFELGTILGMDISEEILTSIFSKFCVGK